MLSQAEIDAMLAGTLEIEQDSSGEQVNLAEIIDPQGESKREEAKSKQVRQYNFWSPNRFSKDQIRAVELVHEDLAERLSSSLPSVVRTDFRPRVVHIEQGRFDHFLNDLPASSLFHMIALTPLPGQMVITLSPNISTVLLEFHLGGRSEAQNKGHELTEIDQSLVSGIIEHMLNDIKASWSNVVSLEPALEDSTTNHRWVQMMLGNDRMLSITLEISVHETTGTMHVYIPYVMIKPIANVLNPQYLISGSKERTVDPRTRSAVMKNVLQVNLDLRVLLGKAKVSIDDILKLQPGDILRLDTAIHNDLSVYVAGRPRYRAQVGKIGRRLAAQITEVVHPLNESELKQ